MFSVIKAASLLLCVISVCRGRSLCISSYYQAGNECCPKCSPGEYVRADCSDESSTQCNPCDDGTFNDGYSRLKRCLNCTSCAPDSGLRIARPCTRTLDAVCEPLEGFFCIKSKGLYCETAEKHRQCKPGQYIRDNGTALTDTVCTDCSAGTFSDGTFTTCRPHTQCENLLREGTALADAECGEGVSSINVTVVIVVVLLVVFLCTGISAALYFRKKKCLSGKCVTVPTQGEENIMIQPPV
ncbi:tumor necrosis factor receptor superfamily member 14-like isoform X1 [Solea senegalensis]|uniref:Tumor necrosis factor receptor superfamily member 14-like isoform X1 n=1 Tax=Solea senegalensis TaxID=28829 RepID=A0AAV6PBY6_SOLSE|nr:tumor necrosis factor receptor superfamily member 14-like isoform X6 [Solea senegalensis]XP_043874927.1 tumor necrosis factor receptor superfamily member 14-like isoform X6 [Solea senegalensis]KAG7453498.1 tumor necrosis factor receptor superfamily member 14-like isoform X1 [Solea senegalensis]